VELGERYTVELVAPVEDYATEEPFPATYIGNRTCGPAFDVRAGDSIELTPVGKQGSASGHGCTCWYAQARTVVSGVELVREERDRPVVVRPRRLSSQARVRVGNCEGHYEVWISTVGRYYLNYGRHTPPTDHILVRKFSTDDPACPAEESELYESEEPGWSCYDSWFVHVRDSSGRMVTSVPSGFRPAADSDGPGEDAGEDPRGPVRGGTSQKE
jgi:hypothetical protein